MCLETSFTAQKQKFIVPRDSRWRSGESGQWARGQFRVNSCHKHFQSLYGITHVVKRQFVLDVLLLKRSFIPVKDVNKLN